MVSLLTYNRLNENWGIYNKDFNESGVGLAVPVPPTFINDPYANVI